MLSLKHTLLIAAAVLACLTSYKAINQYGTASEFVHPANKVAASDEHKKIVAISDGATYGVLMTSAGITTEASSSIYDAAFAVYDLATIRSGRTIALYFDSAGAILGRLVYDIDDEEELIVTRDESGAWRAVRQAIPYEVTERTATGVVSETLYQSALAAGIDEATVIAFADSLQWSVDFSQDVRSGDTFAVVYEERFLNGEKAGSGRVLAGKYVNAGTAAYAIGYTVPGSEFQYYDDNGNSVRKLFLKAPVAYRYISSGFTTGRRYVQAFNVSTGHRAIDYAASYGTPIRAVGDGTVTLAGWDGSYGNKVSVRHNATFSTNYAHMSKFAVKRGEKVSQGDVIGYVGSTGFSTGPHVHYELVKNGVKVNPLAEVLPPGEPIADGEREGFSKIVEKYKKALE
ncbi:MAG: peptidoglycan DD-metalloendopeptidase family protein [Patescibacteria group bacterium]